MKKRAILILTAAAMLFSAAAFAADGSMNMYSNSDFIEKEQPELSTQTKEAISAYQKNPTEENYLALRDIVISDYDAVVARKEAKLAELKEETAGKPGGDEIVAEMAELVDEIHETYWNRINSTMLRFTDPRLLKWKTAEAYKYEYIPVMGAGESIYIKRTPVTCAEYAEFVAETGYVSIGGNDGTYTSGEENFPVNYVSYADAAAYCDWLTEKDGTNTYRLPSESEWELAAGHMPKDADFNCGVNDGRTPVEQYAKATRGAHGAVDFWGNVWEWTSEVRSTDGAITYLGVKGGSWASARTDCRTEYRKESRDSAEGYKDVGFRVIQVLNGEESEVKVDIAALDSSDAAAGESGVSDTSAAENTALPFKDINESDGFYTAVKYVYENGLFNGISAEEFAPNESMTRAMLVTVLARLSGADTSGYASVSFADSVPGEWYAPSVEWAADCGIINGYGNGLFGVNDNITAEQAAVIFARYAEMNGFTVNYTVNPDKFSDISNVSDWAKEQLLWAAENEIYPAEDSLNPTAPASRALLAEMFYGYKNFSPSEKTLSALANIGTDEYGGMNYLLYTPDNAAENMPLIVYLHGVNGKGNNPEALTETNELPKFLSDGDLGEVPAYVLMPQLPVGDKDWIDLKSSVISVIKHVLNTYKIDDGNISLTGFSMGGAGVWNIAASYPEMFCRIAPCGGGIRASEKTLSALSDIPVWTFVGTADTVVNPENTVSFTAELAQINSQARITQFEGASHTEIPGLAYLDKEINLIGWLLGE